MRQALAIALLVHAGWSVFALTQVFKPRAEWAPLRRRLVALDAAYMVTSTWAALALWTGGNARIPAAILGVLILATIPVPCYFSIFNRRPALLMVRNAAFAGMAAGFFALALGLVRF